MELLNKVQTLVDELLNNDNSGHGTDHIKRVLNLTLKFCEKEKANTEIAALIALLHDVDDYKLFGKKNAQNFTNAKNIMKLTNIPEDIQQEVLNALGTIGYNRLLKGVRPTSLEGKIVSDADMCDALGVTGVLRTYKYSLKNDKPFFDRNIYPIENITADKYTRRCSDSSVCHIFEKVLKLKNLMLTDAGKLEAEARHNIVVEILNHLFDEENAPEWKEYLNKHLND